MKLRFVRKKKKKRKKRRCVRFFIHLRQNERCDSSCENDTDPIVSATVYRNIDNKVIVQVITNEIEIRTGKKEEKKKEKALC